MLQRVLLAISALSGGVRCSTDPDEFGRCSPTLQITVHTAPTYEFEWGPGGCEVHTLTVIYAGAVQWHVFTIETLNGLSSPIRYGVTPEGARSSNAESLHRGRRYTVEMTRLVDGLEQVVSRQDFDVP